jgi:hypothetical protein
MLKLLELLHLLDTGQYPKNYTKFRLAVAKVLSPPRVTATRNHRHHVPPPRVTTTCQHHVSPTRVFGRITGKQKE